MDQYFKQLSCYPMYAISRDGFIMNLKTQKILKQSKDNGYKYVTLKYDQGNYMRMNIQYLIDYTYDQIPELVEYNFDIDNIHADT